MFVTSVAAVEPASALLRINYGVIFQKTSDLVLAQDVWYHTFEIDFPNSIDIPPLPSCRPDNKTCSALSHVLAQLDNVRIETATKLNNTISTILDLIPETRIHKSRSRRSLLPFIGQLSKGLFGTATMDDVNILAQHMNKLTRMNIGLTKALSQHENHLSSYISSANARMDNLMKGIKDNMMAIKYMQNQIFTTELTLEHAIDYIMSLLIDQIQTTSNLQNELSEFKLGVNDLVNKKLSPLLLPEHVISSTLQDIQKLLVTKYPGFHLAVSHVQDVYANCQFLYARNGTRIYVTLKLPVSYLEKPVSVYKVLALPVPINSTSDHATQLLNLNEFFVITHNHQYYSTMNSLDLHDCVGLQTKFCRKNMAMTPVTSASCILALYANDKDQIISLCDFRFVSDVVKSQIVEITPNSLLLYRTPLLSMNCPKEQKMVKGCDFCIFQIPCRCSLSTNNLYFIPRLGKCHNHTDNVSVVHPVNLALLQHFFDNKFIEHIFADTTFQASVNVTVPDIKLYEHKMSKVIADDSKAHLSLAKMASVAKNDAVVFKSLLDPVLDGEIQLPTTWPTTNDVITYCSLGATVVMTVLLFWIMFRVRKLSIALSVMQAAQPCKALATEIPSFIYQSVPKNTNSDQTITFSVNLTWEHANFIVLVTIVFALLLILYKYLRNRHRSTLCLEVAAGKQCVLLDVMELPLCLSNLDVQTPNLIENLVLRSSVCSSVLTVSWPDFKIKNKLNDDVLSVENEIPVCWYQVPCLKQILRKTFLVQLYTRHQGIMIPINNWVN